MTSSKKSLLESWVSGQVGYAVDDKYRLPIVTQLTQLLTQLTQDTHLPNLPIKEKILLLLADTNKTINEISKILELPLSTISRHISRGDRNTGLSFEGIIKFK